MPDNPRNQKEAKKNGVCSKMTEPEGSKEEEQCLLQS
jgi:hypothetical protein